VGRKTARHQRGRQSGGMGVNREQIKKKCQERLQPGLVCRCDVRPVRRRIMREEVENNVKRRSSIYLMLAAEGSFRGANRKENAKRGNPTTLRYTTTLNYHDAHSLRYLTITTSNRYTTQLSRRSKHDTQRPLHSSPRCSTVTTLITTMFNTTIFIEST
jgi:hypothetical protein